MIVLSVAVSAVLLLAGIAYHVWREVCWAKERAHLINLVASRTPHEFAVLQRASAATASTNQAEVIDREPAFPVGL